MVFEHNHYRSYLKAVLSERIAANPSYSLRALARDIKVHPSQLSAIIAGHKGLSNDSALKVAQHLKLDSRQTEYFCLLVQYASAGSEEMKDILASRLRALNERGPAVRELSVDLFKLISDWYHFPILEMTQLKDFKADPRDVARRLGISAFEADAAIERLERLELIEKGRDGRYRKVQSNLLVQTKHSNQALQAFHRQMLAKAAESFENQAPEDRYMGTQTFAIDTSQIPAARSLIDAFRRQIVGLFDGGKSRSEVYQLGVQLFKLTHTPTTQKKKEGKKK